MVNGDLQQVAGGEVIDESVATLGDGEPNVGPVVGVHAIMILPSQAPSRGNGGFD